MQRSTILFISIIIFIISAATGYAQENLFEAVNINGDTPLHIAARGYNPGTVELLCAAGADLNRKNINGQTPLQIAYDHKNREAIGILETYLSKRK
ncbi:MAG: ankyrin repeat domain-containing protein [Spirochaetales bacterium]|nr:ankyrin repeat domain-containing protein [Spirochaetales bacterium]